MSVDTERPKVFNLLFSDFHHLSSQTGAHSLPVVWCGAALNQQPAVSPAHLTFGQSARIDAHAADHILRTEEGSKDMIRPAMMSGSKKTDLMNPQILIRLFVMSIFHFFFVMMQPFNPRQA